MALPLALLAAEGWRAWRQQLRDSEREILRVAEAGAEYVRRVLDGHRLRAERVNDLLRGLTDAQVQAREAVLHRALQGLVGFGAEGDISVYVFDRRSRPLVNSHVYPLPLPPLVADRPYVQQLQRPDSPPVLISGPYIGRVDTRPFFALSLRRERTGNALPPGAYDGLINVSVRPGLTAAGLAQLRDDRRDMIALVLPDGGVLADTRQGEQTMPTRRVRDDPILQAMAQGVERASLLAGATTGDPGGARALHRVPGWPVYVVAERPRPVIAARWLAGSWRQWLIFLPAILALLGLGLLVRRSQLALVAANAGLDARVQAGQAELAESAERLRLAQEAAGIGVWEHALTPGSRVIWSAEQFRLFGLDPSTPPLSPNEAMALVEPEDRPLLSLRRLASAASGGGGLFRRDIRIRRDDDGSQRWLATAGRIIPGEEGRPPRLLGVSVDITDRKLAEVALREAELRYRSLFDSAPFSVIIIDSNTHDILDVNDWAIAEYGYSREEFLTMSIRDIDARGDSQAIRAHARKHVVKPGTQEFEAQHRTKSGELRDVLVRVQGLRLGGRDVAYGAHMDITARRRAEEERALLARELDHRAKNALAVVQAALRLTPRTDVDSYARAVESRIMALARAHTLLAAAGWTGAELRPLVEQELDAFRPALPPGATGERHLLEGPAIRIPPEAAQALSMALHELATNAAKHGALSVPEGRLQVRWGLVGETGVLWLDWQERGGPPLTGPPEQRGFGSRMLRAILEVQLQGRFLPRWEREGFACRIEVPARRLGLGREE